MRFVIRAPVGERLVSFCSEIGAESVSDGLEALLQAWKENQLLVWVVFPFHVK